MEEILRIYSKILHRTGSSEKTEQSIIYQYFIKPFTAGIAGFAFFLFILMLFDTSTYLVGINKSISIGITEVIIAVIGFVLQFIYHLFNNYNNR
ncbi:MAG TPA: hypothetical protein VLB50_06705 [Ignavibacteriaceae bacterium]|nr:hypothetical protein [Ignavibacteriaceae bacterium]